MFNTIKFSEKLRKLTNPNDKINFIIKYLYINNKFKVSKNIHTSNTINFVFYRINKYGDKQTFEFEYIFNNYKKTKEIIKNVRFLLRRIDDNYWHEK